MIKHYKLSYICTLSLLFCALFAVNQDVHFLEKAEKVDLDGLTLSVEDLEEINFLRNLGSFSAGTIKANLIGNVIGAASLNVLKSGDVITGALTISGTLTTSGATVNQAIQTVTPTNGQTIAVNAGTSVLLLTPAELITSATITFPASPVEGQFFTVINGSGNSILNITNSAPGLNIINAITSLQPAGISIGALIGYTTVTYMYSSGVWYRWNRG